MTRIASAVMAAAIAASCQSQPPRFPDPTVIVEIIDAGSRPVQFGELRHARVTVFNSTVQPMLLRSASLDDQLPFCLDLMTSLRGRVVERKAFDAWDYQGSLPTTTERIFADDTLLLPGEKTVFEPIPLRVRFSEQSATIWWHTISVVDLLRSTYFPSPGQNESTLRFERMSYMNLRPYREGQPGTLERLVLIPDLEPFGSLRETKRETRLPIRDLGPKHRAIAAASATPGFTAVTHWINGEMWVVDDFVRKRTTAIAKDGTVKPLPRCELEVFDIFDLIGRGVDDVEVRQVDGRSAFVTSSADILALLESARGLGYELRVETLEDADGLPLSVVAVAAPGGAATESTE